jgi:hypothetical protein
MDREMLAAQLKDADETIAARHEQIDLQRKLVARLETEDPEVAEARATLERLELAQALYKQHRDRLAEALKK